MNCSLMRARLLPNEAHYRLSTHCLVEAWPRRHPMPGIYPNARLRAGKEMFSMNHTVCMSNPGKLRHCIICGQFSNSADNCSPASLPDTSQGPTSHEGLSKDNNPRPAVLILLCTLPFPHPHLQFIFSVSPRFAFPYLSPDSVILLLRDQQRLSAWAEH